VFSQATTLPSPARAAFTDLHVAGAIEVAPEVSSRERISSPALHLARDERV